MIFKYEKINLKNLAFRKIPIIRWLPKYKLVDALSDFVAGITVGLTLIPQAIAYAALAGLQPQYGLYSGFAGTLVYIFFGTVKQVNIGPTAVISLLTYNYTHGTNPDFAVLLCFLSGIVEFLSGLLHLGCVVEFVSVPVTAGFSSAAALIIASSQVKGLLGVSIESENFIQTWMELFHNLSDTRPWDLTLSIACCSILLGMRKLKDLKINSCSSINLNKVVNQVNWLLSTARNAMVVVVCAGLAYFLTQHGETPFLLTGTIQPGFPKIALPPFSTIVGNQTYGLLEMCSHLGSGIIVVPLVSLLNNVAIAKAFATEDVFDGTQEMMTLGLCNIAASCFRSMPVSGSFSRSAVNNASGVKSPLGGLYTGCLVILALGFLTPYFFYIPKATLASVIVCAVIFMVEFQLIKYIWKANKKDIIPALATFFACLYSGVEIGILIGLAVDLLHLLYINARPRCDVENKTRSDLQEYILFSPKSGFFFPNIDYIRSKVGEAASLDNVPVVINCQHISVLDFSAIQGLKSMIFDMKNKNRQIIFYKLEENFAHLLSKVIGPNFIHLSTDLSQVSKDVFDSSMSSYNSEKFGTEIEIHKIKLKDTSEIDGDSINR